MNILSINDNKAAEKDLKATPQTKRFVGRLYNGIKNENICKMTRQVLKTDFFNFYFISFLCQTKRQSAGNSEVRGSY